jgi:hypothetical protein
LQWLFTCKYFDLWWVPVWNIYVNT